MTIDFEHSNPETSIARIEEFEQAWGIKLPLCYRNFLLEHNGGSPKRHFFPISGFHDAFGGIQIFFGLDATVMTSDLNWRIQNRIAPFPPGLLEIACTDGNDAVCIQTRVAEAPVYFFDQRPSWGNGIWRDQDLYVIAPSFPEFLSKLTLDTPQA